MIIVAAAAGISFPQFYLVIFLTLAAFVLGFVFTKIAMDMDGPIGTVMVIVYLVAASFVLTLFWGGVLWAAGVELI